MSRAVSFNVMYCKSKQRLDERLNEWSSIHLITTGFLVENNVRAPVCIRINSVLLSWTRALSRAGGVNRLEGVKGLSKVWSGQIQTYTSMFTVWSTTQTEISPHVWGTFKISWKTQQDRKGLKVSLLFCWLMQSYSFYSAFPINICF